MQLRMIIVMCIFLTLKFYQQQDMTQLQMEDWKQSTLFFVTLRFRTLIKPILV